MAKHYDPRTLLKLIAVPLMHEFFRRRGELLELPWHELAERRQTLPIYDAWQALPDDRRRQVQTILQDLLALADNRGMKVFAEEVRIHAPDRSWEFVSCRTRLNKAMWFLLNFPDLFDRAALFARADALAVGRYAVRYTGLPQTPIAVTSESKQALQRALRSYYWPHEMRGHHCHVEHYTRSGGDEYFFAYLDDWPDTRLVFEDNGDLAPRSELYAFSVLFVYCPGDGSLELVARGDPLVQTALQQAFCQAVLAMSAIPDGPRVPAYRLQQVLDPLFTYPTESHDAIARVRLCRIRLAPVGNAFPVASIELKFRPNVVRTEWLEIIQRNLAAYGLAATQVSVQRATFQLIFLQSGLSRVKTLTFTVTPPSLCDLKTKPDEDREIGLRCLKLWGVANDE